MDKTERRIGTVIRVIAFVATLVVLRMFTLSCLFDGPYYRYIFGTIRYYQLPFILLIVAVLLFIAWFAFKGRRALIRFLSLALLLAYACTLLGISEIYLHNKTDMTQDEVLMHYDYKEDNFIDDKDVKREYMYVKKISPKAFKKIDYIEYIFLPDNSEFGKAEIVKSKALIKDNDVDEIAWAKASKRSCHCTNAYILLHKKGNPNAVKVVGGEFVSFKDDTVNRIFARGDRQHYFDGITTMALFYQLVILIALCWVVSSKNFKKKASKALDKVAEFFIDDEE